MILIGDIHGDFEFATKVATMNPGEFVIQVGDFGIGFPHYKAPDLPRNLGFIRGNHDNPEKCLEHPNYMGDYGFTSNVFFIGGAWSFDKPWRTPGKDWWEDEELSGVALSFVLEEFVRLKPKIVVSHTAPKAICKMLCSGTYYENRTETAMDQMWSAHKPDQWIFGHWHKSWSKTVSGTKFTCLDCNEVFRLVS
jgi:predicted phosphodiesterase